MKYEILGGGHVEAATDQELVEALRQEGMAWAPTVSIEDFMEGMAQRGEMQKGEPIRTDSVASFVADIKRLGFVWPAA